MNVTDSIRNSSYFMLYRIKAVNRNINSFANFLSEVTNVKRLFIFSGKGLLPHYASLFVLYSRNII